MTRRAYNAFYGHSGDFIMATRAAWARIRGHNEDAWRVNADGDALAVLVSPIGGLRHVPLLPPCLMVHQYHEQSRASNVDGHTQFDQALICSKSEDAQSESCKQLATLLNGAVWGLSELGGELQCVVDTARPRAACSAVPAHTLQFFAAAGAARDGAR